ncbi:MAG: D-aminoacylase [Acidobacteriota bacterium]
MKRIWIAATLLLQAAALCYGQATYDLVIRNGTVVDGSGKKAFRTDIGIRDGLIARIGNLRGARAGEVIDAKGLVVAPGFIDIHTHADGIAGSPLAENFVRMGVTTVVPGNCGGSAMPIGEALQKIREAGVAANFATLIGHNTVRRAVMGTEQRAPTAEELSRMKDLVARAMSEGAVGLSTGLEYVPGTYSGADEIIELAREAARAGGLYASHMRNEGTEIEKSIAETIHVGETAGCPVHISHLKIDSPSRWGASAAVVSMIEAARRRGLAVTADMYAYSAASSGLSIRFPTWALQGGEAQVRVRLEDPATWEKIQDEMMETLEARGFHDLSWAVIASYRADPSLEGLSIKDAAFRLKGEGSSEAQLEVARDMMLNGGASMVYHLMSEADIRRFMLYPHVSIASDSSLLTFGEGAPHPRGYGNNPRVLSYYVRQRKVLSLEEAIRRMTSLPAAQFGFEKRGLIREGFAADLVVFDRNRVQDRATYANPHQYPTGIGWVIINGLPVVRDGSPTAARPGRILRRSPAAR